MPKNNNKTYSFVACKISFSTFNFHGLILDGQDNLAVEQIAKKGWWVLPPWRSSSRDRMFCLQGVGLDDLGGTFKFYDSYGDAFYFTAPSKKNQHTCTKSGTTKRQKTV